MLGVVRDVAGLHRRRRLVAQRLLDGAGDQRRVGGELAPLIWMVRQQLAHETDEAGGGFVAGTGDHRGVGQHLGARQRPPRSVRLVDLGAASSSVIRSSEGCSARHSMYSANSTMDSCEDVWHDLAGVAPLDESDVGAVAVADLLLIILGDAQQVADGPHRHHGAEVGDEIESGAADQRVEFADTELTHQILDGQHAPRREDARQQSTVQVVQRRILEQQNARRHFDVR